METADTAAVMELKTKKTGKNNPFFLCLLLPISFTKLSGVEREQMLSCHTSLLRIVLHDNMCKTLILLAKKQKKSGNNNNKRTTIKNSLSNYDRSNNNRIKSRGQCFFFIFMSNKISKAFRMYVCILYVDVHEGTFFFPSKTHTRYFFICIIFIKVTLFKLVTGIPEKCSNEEKEWRKCLHSNQL